MNMNKKTVLTIVLIFSIAVISLLGVCAWMVGGEMVDRVCYGDAPRAAQLGLHCPSR